jgi:multidrug efflux pump subunit AcrB
VVLAILVLIFGGLAIVLTPTDIVANIDIPVVSIVWNYNGLDPQDTRLYAGPVLFY